MLSFCCVCTSAASWFVRYLMVLDDNFSWKSKREGVRERERQTDRERETEREELLLSLLFFLLLGLEREIERERDSVLKELVDLLELCFPLPVVSHIALFLFVSLCLCSRGRESPVEVISDGRHSRSTPRSALCPRVWFSFTHKTGNATDRFNIASLTKAMAISRPCTLVWFNRWLGCVSVTLLLSSNRRVLVR